MTKPLGRSGLSVFPLVLGGNVFGWTADERASFAVLDAFVEGGGNALDTADMYSTWVPGHAGGGQSETLIGKWLRRRGRRDDVLIFTKVGMALAPDKTGLAPARIRQAIEASLRRLGTDYVDLYQSHQDDETLPVTAPLEAYARLIEEGKIRAIGASNFSPERLQAALDASAAQGLPRYESLQPEYNLYARDGFEAQLRPVAQAAGIGVIPYFGLASGFLTGKYRTAADLGQSVRGGSIAGKYFNDRGFAILAALDAVAEAHAATPAQVALAWLMQAPGSTAPIASATTAAQATELLGAAALRLTAADVQHLNAASAPAAAPQP